MNRPGGGVESIRLFGLQLSLFDMNSTVDYLFSELENQQLVVREDVNAFKICLKDANSDVERALREASIINLDGMSVVYAARLLCGRKIPRVTGCDLFKRLIDEAANRNKKVFLLGATEEVVSSLADKLAAKYTRELIAGYRNGFFHRSSWAEIVAQVNVSGADFLFVGTPSPQKEEFINFAKNKVKKGTVLMGVGGSFDVLSGKIHRAPLWMQNSGMEWLYRLKQEPRRMWKRYLRTNTKFLFLTLREFFFKFWV